MKEFTRDDVAKRLFIVTMKSLTKETDEGFLGGIWNILKNDSMSASYYALADEVVSKGYKP